MILSVDCSQASACHSALVNPNADNLSYIYDILLVRCCTTLNDVYVKIEFFNVVVNNACYTVNPLYFLDLLVNAEISNRCMQHVIIKDCTTMIGFC